MRARPVATAVTLPVTGSTVATALLFDAHVTPFSTSPMTLTVAFSSRVAPFCSNRTLLVDRLTLRTPATRIVTTPDLLPSARLVARISTSPTPTAVTSPVLLLTLATVLLLLDHEISLLTEPTTSTFAVRVCFSPTLSILATGGTVIPTTPSTSTAV